MHYTEFLKQFNKILTKQVVSMGHKICYPERENKDLKRQLEDWEQLTNERRMNWSEQ